MHTDVQSFFNFFVAHPQQIGILLSVTSHGPNGIYASIIKVFKQGKGYEEVITCYSIKLVVQSLQQL